MNNALLHAALAYLAGAFAMLAIVSWADRSRVFTARDALVLAVIWPVSGALALLMVIGLMLLHAGMRCAIGKPRNGARWGCGRTDPHPGLWALCPWWALAVWWEAP